MAPGSKSLVEERPWLAYAAFMLLDAVLYGLGGYMPWFTPAVMAPGRLDAAIPLSPAAAYPYASYLLLLPVLIAVARRWPGFSRVAAVGMLSALANAAVFAALPTRLASRPEAPAGTLLALLQQVDPPACAFPSGHVGLPVSIGLAALAVALALPRPWARRWRLLGLAYLAWALLLAASALLTKQHVAVDIAGGVVFGTAIALAVAAVQRGALHGPTLAAATCEWAAIALAAAVALRWWSWPVALGAGLVIATRQHALLILYHDGVHGLAARSTRVNDLLVNGFAGVPMLLPLHVYRALHLAHHRHLGTDRDPERSLLYAGQPWHYQPLSTPQLARQLLGDLLPWNGLRMAWRFARDGELRRRLPATRWYPELALLLALYAGLWWGAASLAPQAAQRLALLWFVPYLTLTQLLNKLRSFGEHAAPEGGGELSCSWSTGWLGRATVWPYNIERHLEHHRDPQVPWDELPLRFGPARGRPGRELLPRVWRGAEA